MIRSMTGYSAARREEATYSVGASVKSTNHRYLDLQLRYPAGLEGLESRLRNLVKDRVARGHLEVTISLERAGATALRINRGMLEAYVAAYRQLRGEFGQASDPDLMALLRVPGMVAAENGEFQPDELERVAVSLTGVVTEALDGLNGMRAREGELLEKDLRERLARLASLAARVENLARNVPGLYQKKLLARVKELLEELPGGVTLDAGRLAQEAAYLASRSDITEELTRFRSHLEQVGQLLDGGAEVGKKLDFLLQEMNREANTLLSKTTDVPEVGMEIARQAIEMKTEIEKLREQGQNIE
ncbi:MAG TPA: YicC/YloC family endoribonuclease [Terriglobia bacterium]|nr:YicC/YloC family endoribonuclease [Terriglobia bacterium]